MDVFDLKILPLLPSDFSCFNCHTPRQLKQYTLFDCSKEAGFIALADEGGETLRVGMGRLCQVGDGNCEFAVVVAEGWRKRGVEFKLMLQLKAEATLRGFSV